MVQGFKMKTSEYSFTPFKGLKEALESKRYTFSKKDTIRNKSDEEIFLDAMADVKEIRKFREISPKKPPGITLRPVQKEDTVDILRQIVNGERKIILSDK